MIKAKETTLMSVQIVALGLSLANWSCGSHPGDEAPLDTSASNLLYEGPCSGCPANPSPGYEDDIPDIGTVFHETTSAPTPAPSLPDTPPGSVGYTSPPGGIPDYNTSGGSGGSSVPAPSSEPAPPPPPEACPAGSAPGFWPPKTHDAILKAALPGLTEEELGKVQWGSRDVDAKLGFLPRTLLESEAYKHAMIPGSLVREFGPEKAREMAEQKSADFIEKEIAEAAQTAVDTSLQPSERLLRALFHFGAAMHTIMDAISPAHIGYQLYDTKPYWETASQDAANPSLPINSVTALSWYIADMRHHSCIESREPTAEEMKSMKDAIQARFKELFPGVYHRALGIGPTLEAPPRPPPSRFRVTISEQ